MARWQDGRMKEWQDDRVVDVALLKVDELAMNGVSFHL